MPAISSPRSARRALVIGAGIAGPAAALFLRRAGFEAHLFEARTAPDTIGGGLQIAPNGMHVLDAIGLAEAVLRRGAVCDAMVLRAQSGTPLAELNCCMERRFGPPAVNLRRAVMHEILLDAASSANIPIYLDKRIAGIDDAGEGSIVARFADGTSAESDFIVGADGVHSAVRNIVLPESPHPFDTRLTNLGGFAPRSALEGSGFGSVMSMTFGRRGFFGFGLCGPDEADGAMWWSNLATDGVDAAALRARGQNAIRRLLLDAHADWHAPIGELIARSGAIVATDTLDIARIPAWSKGRTVLIGDAAHAMSPHAGQGASVALEDAMCLAAHLAKESEIPSAFRRFEAERRSRVERIVAAARRNGSRKGEMGAVGAWLRDRVVSVVAPLAARRQDWIYAYRPDMPATSSSRAASGNSFE
jgi:2-polyprenyl-6-methoxyphenol hydroxylase-like FAD-dependent oxidoreductase